MRIAVFLLLFLISSCIKERVTLYKATLVNNSSHKIVVKPYFSSVNPSDKTITLLTNQNFEIAYGTDPGFGNQGFSSSYFGGPNDSVIVTFDDLYSITHYFNTPSSLSTKHYLFNSNRNIGNPVSYSLQTNRLSKYQQENIFTYTFIEQDYLDAK
jgi:hypothetical protein